MYLIAKINFYALYLWQDSINTEWLPTTSIHSDYTSEV